MTLPPQPLNMAALTVERYTLPSGQVVSRYVRRSDGQPVALAETFHLIGPTKFDPPPSGGQPLPP